MSLVYGLSVGISTFVVTFFLLYLDGPFDVIGRIRLLASQEKRLLAGLYECFYCMSTWVCIVISIMYYFVFADITIAHAILVFIIGVGVSSILNMILIER